MLLLFLKNNIPLINDGLDKANIIIKTYSGIIKESTQLAIMIYIYFLLFAISKTRAGANVIVKSLFSADEQ